VGYATPLKHPIGDVSSTYFGGVQEGAKPLLGRPLWAGWCGKNNLGGGDELTNGGFRGEATEGGYWVGRKTSGRGIILIDITY